MLPASEIVFLDEVFKSNSAILNSKLLTLLNERRYSSGGVVIKAPLLSCFGASNEVPTDETLTAIFDRFLLRIRSDNLDAYHFQDLLTKGVQHEIMALTDAPVQPIVSGARDPGAPPPIRAAGCASARSSSASTKAFSSSRSARKACRSPTGAW